ncbi:PepSY-like domain-containing protein [Zobellia barbeyronii]|uniref:PepSY-like domain-containing protein n=1 Tax=Zobellia barbeyronii TaxID=2748009 RepID=A0ABS5WD08_9FLAO|nr:PepSY-like domain-containing protein [Zobellia barbeyronii]MBT2161282.1 PepSY-like domain-containing protein [Zobellia barbeyronii]
MKKIKVLGAVLIAAVIGSGLYSFSTTEDVPQKVKDAFAKKFPAVKKVKWEKESDTEWEGEFKMKGTDFSANFLEDGTWQETEHEIKKKAIPANVKTTLDTEFLGYKIEEVEISETQEGSVYEFELEMGEEELEIVIDTNGKVVNKKIKLKDKD